MRQILYPSYQIFLSVPSLGSSITECDGLAKLFVISNERSWDDGGYVISGELGEESHSALIGTLLCISSRSLSLLGLPFQIK